jgi:sulfide:quinone oxidoreductase
LKCPSASTKITFLAEEVFRLTGVRDKTNVIYNHGSTQIFGIEYFAHAIEKLADERGIKRNFYTN